MELFTSTQTQHLPQSVLSVKSKNGLNYSSSSGSNPVIDFELAGSIGYYLAEDVVLSFDFEYTSSDGIVYNLRPQNNQSLAGMINQLSIYSLSDGVLLEEIQDYNVLNAVLMSHNNGSDQEMKDGVFKRMSMTQSYTNDYDDITPFVTPNAHPASPTAVWSEPQAYQTQKIQLPLKLSSLLSASTVIPVGALGGLRIRLQLNSPESFNMVHGYDVDGVVVTDETAGNIFVVDVGSTLSIDSFIVIDGYNSTLTSTGGATVEIEAGEYTATTLATKLNAILPAIGLGNLDASAPDANSIVFTNNTGASVSIEGTAISVLLGTDSPLVIPDAVSTGSLAIQEPVISYASFSGGADDLLDFLNAGVTDTFGDAVIVFTSIALVNNVWTLSVQNPSANGFNLIGTLFGSLIDADNLDVEASSSATAPLNSGGTGANELFLPQVNFYLNNPASLNTCPFKIGQELNVNVGSALIGTSKIIDMTVAEGGITLQFASNLPASITGASGLLVVKSRMPDRGVINYNLRNVSIEVPVITPPPAYVVSLQKAMASAGGLPMDIKAFQLVRSSVQQGQTMTSMNLPFTASRGKGVISIPHIVETNSFLTRTLANNFSFLQLTKYFYEYMNVKHPERGIDTEKARQESLSQELMIEQMKTFEYCLGDKFLSLDGYSNMYKNKTFFLGRSLGVFNTSMITTNSNLGLTIEATSQDGGVTKSFNVSHYCSCINSIVMRPNGVVLVK